MPQPGLHAVLALASRKWFPARPLFALGLVFGALLPDADGYAQAAAILIGKMDSHTADALYHRTLTHSLFFAAAVALFFYLGSLVRGSQAWRVFGLGLAAGIAVLHTLVDIFAWFDGVGVLWPLWSIDLWGWLSLPELAAKLLRTGNFYAFALYFAYLSALARRGGTDSSYLPRLKRYTYLQVGLGLVFTSLALTLSARGYDTLDGAVFLLLAFPNAIWVTWQMRATIESGQPARELKAASIP